MSRRSLHLSIWQASFLSLAAVAGLALLQGAVLFHQEVSDLREPSQNSVRGFAPFDDGRRGVFACTVTSSVSDAPFESISGIYDLTCDPPKIVQRFPGLEAIAVCAGGQRAFLSCHSGKIFTCDLTSPGSPPQFLGQHGCTGPRVLECSPDGSILVAATAGSRAVMAWDAEARRPLWRRGDLDVRSCTFMRPGRRQFVGLDTGEILELDSLSGQTLAKLVRLDGPALSISAAPRQGGLAALDMNGNLVVVDVPSGRLRWRAHFFKSATRLSFTRDGERLAVAYPSAAEALTVFDAGSGKRLEGVAPLESAIPLGSAVTGVAVAPQGTIYAWQSGTVMAWKSMAWRSGRPTHFRQFSPARDWASL